MKPLILLIDDDASLIEICTETLSEAGYEVISAQNGNIAKTLLQQKKIDLAISDIQMAECGGVELYRWVKEQKYTVPFIFLTGFSSIAETKELVAMGAQGIFPKPLKDIELIAAVKRTLVTKKAGSDLILFDDKKFARLSIEDFLFGKNIPFTIYVKISQDKLARISRAGENIALDRLQAMRAKGITEFWLSSEDFKKYSEIANTVRDAALGQTKITKEKKVRLINHTIEMAFEQLRISGIDQNVCKNTEATLLQALTAFSASDLGTSLLSTIESRGSSPFGHAASCAAFAVLICKVMGWSSQKNIMLLTMSAYLHDIGMLNLPIELQEKDPATMTEAELEMYKQHPTYGAIEIRKMPGAPEHLATIIEQHHENGSTSGFPKGLARSDIFPMASILHFIDEFAEHLARPLPKPRPGDPKPPGNNIANAKAIHVLELIKNDKNAFFDKSAALALELLFKYNDVNLAKSIYEKQNGIGFNRS